MVFPVSTALTATYLCHVAYIRNKAVLLAELCCVRYINVCIFQTGNILSKTEHTQNEQHTSTGQKDVQNARKKIWRTDECRANMLPHINHKNSAFLIGLYSYGLSELE
jgi:hypothetical protein